MARVRSKHVHEAKQLLTEILSWSEDDVDQLPKFYREKVERYRELAKQGEA